MTYTEVYDWFELRSWYYAPDEDAGHPGQDARSRTERAFFHLN